MFRSHGLRWLGASLACIGGLSLLGALALVAWQYASRVQTGKWSAIPAASILEGAPEALTWMLERVHPGLPLAAIGLVLLVCGVLMVVRQNEILQIEERAAADRLRRVRLGQYGYPADRREPYIGVVITEVPERTKRAA